jgi:transposase
MESFPRDPGRMSGAAMERRDPEVPERARRRTFTAKYKLEILAAYDAAPDGEKGALLRREGLYTSHIAQWLRARDTGALAAQAEQIARLEQEKRQLQQDVDVQTRLRALLETVAESAGIDAHRAQRPEAVR